MYDSGGSYVHRAVETDIIDYVREALTDPLERFSVALITGQPGFGLGTLLGRGVITQLSKVTPPLMHQPMHTRGTWGSGGSGGSGPDATQARIAFALTAAEVPTTPPPPRSTVRVLLIACTDIDALPEWVTGDPSLYVRTLPVGPLTLFEAHDFIEAQLGGPIDAQSALTLAQLAGFVPLPLSVITAECRTTGTLERIDGQWALLGDPVHEAIVPYVQAQLASVSPDYATIMFRLALAEPFLLDDLTTPEREAAEQLLREGELGWRPDGRMGFVAPAGAAAIRSLAPATLTATATATATATSDALPSPFAGRDQVEQAAPPEARPHEALPNAEHVPSALPSVAADALQLVDAGRPARALRRLSQAGRTTTLHRVALSRASLSRAALSSDGPDTFQSLERRVFDVGGHARLSDVAPLYALRAAWLFARGEIVSAHRFAQLAVDAADAADAADAVGGDDVATIALLAEISAIRGDHAAATAHLARAVHTSHGARTDLAELSTAEQMATHAEALAATETQAHIAATRLLLGVPRAGELLRAQGAQYASQARFGATAAVLYAGVRFGRRRAATDLCAIAHHLDGELHRLRVEHARALLADDPVALFTTAEQLRASGLALHAAEIAATVLRMRSLPRSLHDRASRQLAAYLSGHAAETFAGHALLHTGTLTPDARLTPREREVAQLIDTGLSNAEIADRLSLSVATIEGHITRIYRKTGGQRRAPARQG